MPAPDRERSLHRHGALVWTLFVIAIALTIYAPALSAGYLADDVYQIALHDGLLGPRSPWSLYSLYVEDPVTTAAHMQRGSLPWWTVPEFRFVQLRPLSSALIDLDHTLRPRDAFAHHLHSAAWLVATLVTAHLALRRATSSTIAGLALLVYAIDETFGWTLAWIANRCSMVAATFAFAALAVHQRRVEDHAKRWWWIELGLWLLAFAAGEYALCGLAYVLAFTLVGRRDPWRRRARALLPAGVAFVAFVCLYLAIEAGVSGATSYVDPLAHPLEFIVACTDRIPRMLGEIGLALPGESDRLLIRYEGSAILTAMMAMAGIDSEAQLVVAHARMVVVALVVVLVPAWLLARRHLSATERRAVAWTMLGSLGALVPLSAILPSTRALALAALGPAMLVSSLAVASVRAWRARPHTISPRLRATLLTLLAGALLLQHTIVDAFWARIQIAGIRSTGRSYARFHENAATRELDLAGKHVVVIAAPGLVTGLHGLWMMHLLGRPMPATWHVLAMGERRLLVRRFDERTLEVSTLARAMHDQPQETLFRPPSAALRTGDEIDLRLFRARIVHERENQGIDAVHFTFDRPPEDPSLVFLVAGPEGLEPFGWPALGRSVVLAPPTLPGLSNATPRAGR